MQAARIALVLAVGLVLWPSPAVAAKRGEPPRPAAEAWTLVDARDGERLAGHRAARERPIASATKLMTAYLALEEMRLRKRIAAPPYDALPVESVLGLQSGERITVRDLIYSLVLASANDGAVAVAEGVSGSVDGFVRRMNAASAELDLADTSFANPIGLDDPMNYSSPRDLARLATVLLSDRFFRRVADSEEHVVRTDRATRRIETRNDLLRRVGWVTGVKTGYTQGAGYVLVGSGERKGARLVAVVLGAPSEAARDEAVLELLDYGFSLYRPQAPVRRSRAVAEPEVDSGGTVPLLAKRGIRVAVRRDQRVETEVTAPPRLEGPVRRGQRLGRVVVEVDGRRAGSAPLVAGRSAPAATLGDDVRGGLPLVGLAVLGGGVILIALLAARRRSPGAGTTKERPRR